MPNPDYLGQTPPEDTPVVFAPGIILGKGKLLCFPSFSSAGNKIVWMTLPPKLFYVNYDGKWTDPINLNSKIGFNEDSRNAYISPDQKYLSFCSRENIYWVDAKIIEKLRKE